MEHAQDLTNIALVITVALAGGLLLNALRQPAIVGFILAGVVLGPTGLGLVVNAEAITVLAELGVLMLLFIIGMELDLRALRNDYLVAAGTMLLQVAVSLAVIVGLTQVLGFSLGLGIVLGFVVALSSTAVALKMMEDVGELKTPVGRLTTGILIAQDLAVVPMLLIISSLGKAEFDVVDLAWRLALAVGLLAVLMLFLTRRGIVRLPLTKRIARHADIGTLAIMAVCFLAATASGLLGLSPALGAFLAGLIVGNSTLRRPAIRAAVPVQSILLVIFFLSIGLLIDLSYIWANAALVIGLVLLVTLGKTAMNIGILRLLRRPWGEAFPTGLFLAQIGEFSFVLAAAGVTAGALDQEGYRLSIAVIALSLITSPLWYVSARRFHDLTIDRLTNMRTTMAAVYPRASALSVRLGKAGRAGASRFRRSATKSVHKQQMKRRSDNQPPGGERPTPPAPADGD